jgi:hypothetical protein
LFQFCTITLSDTGGDFYSIHEHRLTDEKTLLYRQSPRTDEEITISSSVLRGLEERLALKREAMVCGDSLIEWHFFISSRIVAAEEAPDS